MKRILVPTDFSATSLKALDYAVSIAKKAGAEIILLHVCELIRSPFLDQKLYFEKQNSSKVSELQTRLNNYKESIEQTENIVVQTELYDGEVIASVSEIIKNRHPDLIVMGTQGKSTIKNKIFGSNTAHVLAQSSVPVITIPFDFEWAEPTRVLLALNHENEDPNILKPVFEIADLFNAEVMTAIFTDSREYALDVMEDSRTIYTIREKLSKAFNRNFDDAVHLSGNDFQDAVQEYIGFNGINLLAMVSHKANIPQPFFHRSSTKQMSYHTTVPLLSINAPV